MEKDEEIRRRLKELKDGKASIFPMTVISVNKDERLICARDIHDIDYPDVRLKASIIESDDLVIYPRVGSEVLVGIIGNDENEIFVIQFTEVDEIEIKIKDISLKMNEDGIELNGSGFSGLVKADEIKEQIDKNTKILETLQTVFNAWATIPNDGGAALKALSTQFTSLPRADLSNIKNGNVSHG